MAQVKHSIWEGENVVITLSILVLFVTLPLSVIAAISKKSYETRTQAAEIYCPPPDYQCPLGYSCEIDPNYPTPRCVKE